jgi:tetratricopeptide (TPR) repeat protein
MNRFAVVAAALVGLSFWAVPAPAPAQEAKEAHPGNELFNPDAADVTTAELLDRLFGQLHQARDDDQAKLIEQAIWKVWSRSGSSSADLLLAQAEKAMRARAYPTAIAILDTVIDLKPDFAEAWNKRATTYYLMRRFDQSLADIDRVLELEPRHFGALAGRGMILRAQGKKREALEAFRRALTIYPEMPGPKGAVKELTPEVEQDI